MVSAPLVLADLMCCPGQLDRDPLVVGGGVEPAAFGPPAVIDRPAAEDLGEPFERDVVAGIDKAVATGRTGDVAAVEGRDREPGQRVDHQLSQPLDADIFVEHPEEMADAGASAVMQALLGKPRIDLAGKLRLLRERGVGVEQVERAGVADRHQRQAGALGQRKDAHVERMEAERIDRAQLARAGAGRRLELR